MAPDILVWINRSHHAIKRLSIATHHVLLAVMRSRRSAQSSYSTRTQTGSVKRKHYDHLSDSDHDTASKSVVVRRRIPIVDNAASASQSPTLSPGQASYHDPLTVEVPLVTVASAATASQQQTQETQPTTENGYKPPEDDSDAETDIYSDSGTESKAVEPKRSTPIASANASVASSVRSSPRKIVTARKVNGFSESTRPRRNAAYNRHYRDDDDDEDSFNDHTYGVKPRPTNGRPQRACASNYEQGGDSEVSDTEVEQTQSRSVSSRGRIRKTRHFYDDG